MLRLGVESGRASVTLSIITKNWVRRKKKSGIATSKSRHKNTVSRMKTEHYVMKFGFKHLNFIIPTVRIYTIILDMKEICFKLNFFAAF